MNLDNAVAVVGIACRFPGADSPEEYWEVLKNAENHIREVPDDRWNKKYFYSKDRSQAGKTFAIHAGILKEDVRMWDNKPFGINVMEAELMDPQQRLALETTYRALEDGGFTLEDINDTNTAVYMGLMNNDFQSLAYMDPKFMDNYSPTGTTNSILSNRLSYFYNVHGPSVSVDTACSSGLVAVNLGAQSILNGESDMAMCGGVACILSPTTFIALSKARMASEVGQCQTYTENADGYVRSEGCGVVVLKNLKKALADGNKIWGVVTTACNSDGKATTPITAPSSKMQSELIERTLKRAGVSAKQIQFVEMHGTGTPVGDPVETSAVGSVIGAAKRQANMSPVPVGSVKTNIGHLEAGAGIAGLMKVLLMMKHETMAPSVKFGRLKETLNLAENHVHVLQEPVSWKPLRHNKEEVRLASVNSFGFGGTNVHLVAQSSDSYDQRKLITTTEKCNGPQIVLFTGFDATAMKASMKDTYDYIASHTDLDLQEIARTSTFHRTMYPNKVAVLASDLVDFQNKLGTLLETSSELGKRVSNKEKRNVIFVFCGMGTHWTKMGAQLYDAEPAYRETVERLHSLFESFGDFDLKGCIAGEFDLENPAYGQPSIFACQVALYELWKSKGVVPNVIVGHSVGEVAASYASGRLSLEEAAYVIYHRGRIVSRASDGGMLAVGNLDVTEVETLLKRFADKVQVAAYNSPRSCTISGDISVLKEIESILEKRDPKPFLRKLAVSVAYHSSYMDPVLSEIVHVLDEHFLGSSFEGANLIPQVSTVSGRNAILGDYRTGEYWTQNVRNSVRFTQAMQKALDNDCTNVILEVGPKPALKTNIKEISAASKFELFCSMMANKDDILYTSLSKLYELGAFKQIKSTTPLTVVPRYAFQREMLYKEPEIATNLREGRQVEQSSGQHPFVFKSRSDAIESSICKVSNETTRFVFEHRLDGNIIVPGATYAEMGIAAACQTYSNNVYLDGNLHIKARVHFNQVCLLKNETSTADLKVACHRDSQNQYKFNFDVTAGETLHAAGRVLLSKENNNIPPNLNLKCIGKGHNFHFDDRFFYDTLETYGFTYGPSLRCIKNGSTDYKDCIVELEIPDDTDLRNTFIHPAVLDSLLQGGIMFPAESTEQIGGQILPYGVNEILLYRPLTKHMYMYMRPSKSLEFTWEIDALLTDDTGVVLAECKGITYGLVGQHLNYDVEQHMFTSSWKQFEMPANNVLTSSEKKMLLVIEKGSTFPVSSVKGNVDVLQFSETQLNEISEHEDALLKYMRRDVSEYEAIVYTTGFQKRPQLDVVTGEEMDLSVKHATFTLLQMVKLVSKGKNAPRMYAVTQGVYAFLKMQQLQPENEYNTLIGVTVNAMCRSVNKELSSFGMHSIDIDKITPKHIALVEQLLWNDQDYFEYVVFENNVYFGTLDAAEQTGIGLGKIMNASNSKLNLQFSSQERQMLMKPTSESNVKNKSRTSLECVRLDQEPNCQQSFSSSTVPMTCIDAIGLTSENKRVHICQRQEITSDLSPNATNCMSWSTLPTEYPTLSYWITMWKAMNNLKKGQSMYLKTHNVASTWEIVTRTIASLFRIKQVNEITQADVIVVVASDLNFDIQQTKAQLVLVYDAPHGNAMNTDTLTVSKFVPTSLVLTNQKIMETLPKFEAWLKTVQKSRISKAMDLFDQTMYRISENLTISDFTDITHTLPAKPTFLTLKINGRIPYMVATTPKETIRANAGYLLVGGRKGLGWETVVYLVEHGAKYIGVISRSGLEQDKIIESRNLENKHGCKIIDLLADACNMSDLKVAFQNFQMETRVPIRGIFYGAAVTCDSIIPAMTIDKFMLAISPKVCGVWNTYILSKHLDLDIFVMYSSITSTFGNAGQTNYGAGNAFKDAISCLRRIKMGVGQSICWGALDLGILVDNQNARKKVQQLGLAPMKLSEILTSLDHALVSNQPIMAYVRFIWPAWYRYLWSGPEVLRTQYSSLIQRFCHNLKRGKQAKELLGNAKNNQEYVVEVLKTVAVLSDEDISLQASMADLGADSQDRQKIYNVFVEDIGFNEEDMTLIEMGDMVLSDLIKHMKNIKAKYGKDSPDIATPSSKEEGAEAVKSVSASEQTQHTVSSVVKTNEINGHATSNGNKIVDRSREIIKSPDTKTSNGVDSKRHTHRMQNSTSGTTVPIANGRTYEPASLSTKNGGSHVNHYSSQDLSAQSDLKKKKKKMGSLFRSKKTEYELGTRL